METKDKKSPLIRPVILLAALFIILGACSKYDDGPFMSLYSKGKRVEGRWYFSNVRYNDIDSTDSYRVEPIQAIQFYTNPDKDVNWSAYTWFFSGVENPRTDYGYWRFNEEMDSIFMVTTVSVYSGELAVSDTVEYSWKINRLAYTEFWLDRTYNDTTTVSWKLWKLAY